MMAKTGDRKVRPLVRLQVLRTERLTPHMIRVVAGGAGLADFAPNGFTDSYVKLVFRIPNVQYPEPFDLAVIHDQLPREQWPQTRTYTVRSCDKSAGEITIDFVHHGDEGLAGPWAAQARPGDELLLRGPGGAYAPSDKVDWHLLVGDESALPAISAALEAMPAGVPAKVFIQVEDAVEKQNLLTKANAEFTWLYRNSGSADLLAAVRETDFGLGTVQAFVHGEAGFVAELRRYLRDERDVPRELLSLSGYWRRGKNEEGWREEKAAAKASEKAS